MCTVYHSFQNFAQNRQHGDRPVVFYQKFVFRFIQRCYTSDLPQGRHSSIHDRFINEIRYQESKLHFSISHKPCRYFIQSSCLVYFQGFQDLETQGNTSCMYAMLRYATIHKHVEFRHMHKCVNTADLQGNASALCC